MHLDDSPETPDPEHTEFGEIITYLVSKYSKDIDTIVLDGETYIVKDLLRWLGDAADALIFQRNVEALLEG